MIGNEIAARLAADELRHRAGRARHAADRVELAVVGVLEALVAVSDTDTWTGPLAVQGRLAFADARRTAAAVVDELRSTAASLERRAELLGG